MSNMKHWREKKWRKKKKTIHGGQYRFACSLGAMEKQKNENYHNKTLDDTNCPQFNVDNFCCARLVRPTADWSSPFRYPFAHCQRRSHQLRLTAQRRVETVARCGRVCNARTHTATYTSTWPWSPAGDAGCVFAFFHSLVWSYIHDFFVNLSSFLSCHFDPRWNSSCVARWSLADAARMTAGRSGVSPLLSHIINTHCGGHLYMCRARSSCMCERDRSAVAVTNRHNNNKRKMKKKT